MKNLLIVFGLLDLIAFGSAVPHLPTILDSHGQFSVVRLLLAIVVFSELFSGILFLMKRKTAMYIYYFQFPFKVITSNLTLGFLVTLVGVQQESKLNNFAFGYLIAFEVARLLLTIWIHRKFFRNP